MGQGFSDEHVAMAADAARMLATRCPSPVLRAVVDGTLDHDANLYASMAELGWLGIVVPTEFGGVGLDVLALCAFAEQIGKVLAPVPFMSTQFVAMALLGCGSPAQQAEHLPALAAGTSIGCIALSDAPGVPKSARGSVGTYVEAGRLFGGKMPVMDGVIADFALVSARDLEGIEALYLVNLRVDGVVRESLKSLDPARSLAALHFSGASCERLGNPVDRLQVDKLLDLAAVLTAFEQLGVAGHCLETALAYVGERQAFGRKIGAFQATKHKLAQLHIEIELARSNAFRAARSLAGGDADLPMAAACARLSATTALDRASREAISIFGGIGVTWEHDCHLYYRRARHLAVSLGNADRWRDRLFQYLPGRLNDSVDEPGKVVAAETDYELGHFRLKARAWLASNAPAYTPPSKANDWELEQLLRRWQAAKAAAGYAGISVSAIYGGGDGSVMEEIAFAEEESYFPIAQIPVPYLTIAVSNVVPLLLEFGTDDQKSELIAPTLRGELTWCELFSEPSAGSDIANLRTKAEYNGRVWKVNGQKVWTSGAQFADLGLLLARSDSSLPRHQGLTYFVVDMQSSGVEVRPIRQMSGRSEFNEVFLSEVEVADCNRLGAVGQGWQMILAGLSLARVTAVGGAASVFGGKILKPLFVLLDGLLGAHGIDLVQGDATVRRRLADYHVALSGIENMYQRLVENIGNGRPMGAEGSIAKIALTRWLQDMSLFGIDCAGHGGMVSGDHYPGLERIQDAWLTSPGFRIAGGTEEINLNMIAERILGLPRDVDPTRQLPFDQINAGYGTG